MLRQFTNLMKARIPDLLLLLVALIWGIGFSVTNDALLSGVSPSLLLALRMLIPGAVFWLFFFRDRSEERRGGKEFI